MDKRLFSYINWGLLACMFLLYFLGVGNLYSASGTRLEDGLAFSGFYQRQLIWGVCGLACMLLAMSFDYRQLRNLAWPFFLISLALLLLVPVAGKTVYGAKRWLSLGFMSIQPSELAKLAVLVLAARLLARDGRPLGWKDFSAVLTVGLIPAALIVTQPDLGTTLMILLILGGMILFHGLKGYVLKTCLLAVPCAAAFMWFVGMHDYQRQRILTFLDPGNDPRGTGYHILQSRIAIGSGQLWGKGFKEGTQSQLRFLPERHSDFAVAVFGEEWGFVGCVALVTLFCLFLLSIFSTAVQAKDRFGSMLVVGVFFYFFWQIFINMGMVIGLMPVVGIPLPFISYGGSATLVNFTLLGIVLNVSMRRFMFKG
ncbi:MULTISPECIES: rod shape-determining protein RodA [Desulfovibrio]|uniref:Peptidoglycan glycosyltransferase RodA n=1 Tax=Desulfovibrio fairfieldensis TaxID=44742 RepID=A0A109W518_9BACT|nr:MULTISPECIES: rod shape-determining protein RodA [Desulfovibrio]AMD91324.1 rod shape-determining protein RodA [Desulfovibrio fairfieldensis]MBS6829477.1 rod shape-determining protein RodA [Desulfovibrio sp.]GKG93667.1 rod shape-determining protein RodA [Desulfovibrionaceae bacterium]GKI12219.1 rod shape-determining protein RodA [Desulfovibrionaceae bacterium]